jgi:class 3 adenylate cyclase
MSQTRRLAAILASDVVGYSRLWGCAVTRRRFPDRHALPIASHVHLIDP